MTYPLRLRACLKNLLPLILWRRGMGRGGLFVGVGSYFGASSAIIRHVLIPLACLTVLCALAEQAGVSPRAVAPDSWPQWRGPLANGVAPRANPPIHWSETNNIRWKTVLPGKAHSSPIIFGDSVYLLSARPVGGAQKPVYDDAPGVHDSVLVTNRHQFLAFEVSRRSGRVSCMIVLREELPLEDSHESGGSD